jgi:hypothetical protein
MTMTEGRLFDDMSYDEVCATADRYGIDYAKGITPKRDLYQAIVVHLTDLLARGEDPEPLDNVTARAAADATMTLVQAVEDADEPTRRALAKVEMLAAEMEEQAIARHPAAAVSLVGGADSADQSKGEAAVELWRNGDVEPGAQELPSLGRWALMEAMAAKLAHSKLMPKAIRESRDPEADCLVILLAANDLALNPTTALHEVQVIEGKPTLSAKLMRMLVRRAGHEMWTEVHYHETSHRPTAAACFARHKAFPDRLLEAQYTTDDALGAGLIQQIMPDGSVKARSQSGGRKPWESYTEDMLVARATSRLCRREFEMELGGFSYTPEELGSIEVYGEEVDQPDRNFPPERDATELEVEARRVAIAALTDDARAALAIAWKAGNLPHLNPPDGWTGQPVTDRWLPFIDEEIARARAAHPHPEVEPEQADAAAEDAVLVCPGCGLDPEVANADCDEHPFT